MVGVGVEGGGSPMHIPRDSEKGNGNPKGGGSGLKIPKNEKTNQLIRDSRYANRKPKPYSLGYYTQIRNISNLRSH